MLVLSGMSGLKYVRSIVRDMPYKLKSTLDSRSPELPDSRTPGLRTLDSGLRIMEAENPDAEIAVSLRDASRQLRYDRKGDRIFHAASTMKIPVMIEVYRQAGLGRFSLEDELDAVNAFRSIVDGSMYSIAEDSEDAIYQKLGGRMSVRDLVYQMITVSSNLATNLLIDLVSADSAQETAKRLGVERMKVLRGVEDLKAFELGKNNTVTSADLALLLEALLEGRAVSPEADAQMIDILLDQQFNEMIPAGLPDDVRVAHKTGEITKIHHDAGIVYPNTGNPYVLVILIEGIEDKKASAEIGTALSRVVHSRFFA